MTKKQIVGEIQDKLKTLGVKQNECVSIDTLTDAYWVSYKQILLRNHIPGVLYRNHKMPLYSKGVSLEELLAINKELEDKIVKRRLGNRLVVSKLFRTFPVETNKTNYNYE